MNSPQASAAQPPLIVPRPEHSISRSQISEHALKVLYRLRGAGYQAYLVGGGVRDLLLGREPKDFDVATNARPEEVKALFRNCRLIGRRFRLAHVRFGDEIVEVATFRALHAPEREAEDTDEDELDHARDESGRILRDNVYGTLEEDAWRRDFTVNALYYNIDDFSVVDYTGGLADLRAGVLRLIGDPDKRFREDPVRMLRAVRFAVKLGFRIHPETEKRIFELGPLLRDIPPARLFEETIKLFMMGYGVQAFEMLRHYGLFGHLFPMTQECLEREEQGFPVMFLVRALESTDRRVAENKPVTPVFLFATLLWEPVRVRAQALMAQGIAEIAALRLAGEEIVERQQQHVALPRRFAVPMREIFELQPRFNMRQGKRAARLLAHPRFRAAYDFLVLRAQAGEVDGELAEWWTNVQSVDAEAREKLLRAMPEPGRRRRRRRGRRGTGAPPAPAE
ncbi:MAG TPA: polynucleotide adenylyltransferase PcnB [Gammaproteobacteria bacterium]|nr:polynucleotide adenylyltransferase PcnB [Gammaproteobacteria bacterium]